MRTFAGHSRPVLGLAFAPDGSRLASASADSTVRVWSIDGEELFRHTAPFSRATAVAFAPDGSGLAAAFAGSPTPPNGVAMWWRPADAGRPEHTLPHEEAWRAIAFGPNAALYLAGPSELLRLEYAAGITARAHLHGDSFSEVAVGLGRVVALTVVLAEVLTFAPNLSSRRELTRGPLTRYRPRGLSVAADSGRVAFGAGRFLAVWDDDRARTPRVWPAHGRGVFASAFAPDGRTLLTAGADGSIKYWDIDGATEVARYDWGVGEIYSLAIAPDGLTAAAGGLTDIVVWDLDL